MKKSSIKEYFIKSIHKTQTKEIKPKLQKIGEHRLKLETYNLINLLQNHEKRHQKYLKGLKLNLITFAT